MLVLIVFSNALKFNTVTSSLLFTRKKFKVRFFREHLNYSTWKSYIIYFITVTAPAKTPLLLVPLFRIFTWFLCYFLWPWRNQYVLSKLSMTKHLPNDSAAFFFNIWKLHFFTLPLLFEPQKIILCYWINWFRWWFFIFLFGVLN